MIFVPNRTICISDQLFDIFSFDIFCHHALICFHALNDVLQIQLVDLCVYLEAVREKDGTILH